MQRPSPSTRTHPAALDGRDQACLDARAWLQRRQRWENRLAELQVLAGVRVTTPRLQAGRRVVQARSGVLVRAGRSAGVCA